MKRILLIAIALLLGFLLASAAWYYSRFKKHTTHFPVTPVVTAELMNNN